jgi:hypothetical protein
VARETPAMVQTDLRGIATSVLRKEAVPTLCRDVDGDTDAGCAAVDLRDARVRDVTGRTPESRRAGALSAAVASLLPEECSGGLRFHPREPGLAVPCRVEAARGQGAAVTCGGRAAGCCRAQRLVGPTLR